MTKDTSVEIEADELSDEVIESLVEEGGLDESEAEKLGDEVWFKEVDVGEGNKTGALSYVKAQYENSAEIAGSIKNLFVNQKTTRAEVVSVERCRTHHVKIRLSHARFSSVQHFNLHYDSDILANLMTYKSVSNLKDLEGCKLLVLPESFDSRDVTVLIPHNVSLTGQLRFKSYSLICETREKHKISVINNLDGRHFTDFLRLLPVMGALASIGVIVRSVSKILRGLLITPLALYILILLFVTVYCLTHFTLLVTAVLLHSDFEEVEIINSNY